MINIQVMNSNSNISNLGYNDDNFYTNGEYLVIKHFIKSNDIIFDVGSNKGCWSNLVLNENLNCIVYAFDPLNTKDIQVLSEKYKNLKLFDKILYHKNETIPFYYYPDISELSTVFKRNDAIEKRFNLQPIVCEKVTQTIDSFCLEHKINSIDFLKIDTEGSEPFVLDGAKQMLSDNKIQTIQFEYGGCYLDSKKTLKDLYLLLLKYNYNVFRIYKDGLIKIQQWDDALENYLLCNYVATKERVSS